MFYAMHDRPGEGGTEFVDPFLYFLSEKLGVPVHDIEQWPVHTVLGYRSYYTVQHGMQAHQMKATKAARS